MPRPLELFIGIMSGTSLDGIDAVLMATNGHQAELTASSSRPFAAGLRQRLLAVANGAAINAREWGQLDAELGQVYADIVLQLLQESGTQACQVRAIGCHGQTLWHQPNGELPFSLQLGDANRIAALTGIITINDFRRKDLALGGQGAPLVPAFHQQVLADSRRLRVVVNIGGIANITILSPNILAPAQGVSGYDVGPGNMLMDAWCQQQWGLPYDKDAHFGLQGQVNSELLDRLLAEPWLALPAPKSTGRELFSPEWLTKHLAAHLQACPAPLAAIDVQATLAEFSARAIVDQVQLCSSTGDMPAQLLVCGGGGHNPLLMQRLSALLPNWQVTTTNAAGVDMDAMEAMAFAWLAHQTLNGLPGNLPAVTGASRPAILGAIHLPG